MALEARFYCGSELNLSTGDKVIIAVVDDMGSFVDKLLSARFQQCRFVSQMDENGRPSVVPFIVIIGLGEERVKSTHGLAVLLFEHLPVCQQVARDNIILPLAGVAELAEFVLHGGRKGLTFAFGILGVVPVEKKVRNPRISIVPIFVVM